MPTHSRRSPARPYLAGLCLLFGCTGGPRSLPPDAGLPDAGLPDGGLPDAGQALPAHLAQRSEDFVQSIGVNAHLTYAGPYTRSTLTPYDFFNPRLLASGIRNIRSSLGQTEAVADEHALLGDAGVRFLFTPSGSQRTGTQLATYLAPERGWARFFEGVNEPNLQDDFGTYPDPRNPWWVDTRAFQEDLFAAFRANPDTADLPVLAPPLGYLSAAKLTQAYAQLGDVSAWSDLGTTHCYPFAEGSDTDIGLPSSYAVKVAPAQAAVDGKPMVASETGYNTLTGPRATGQLGVSEQAQARYVPRLLLEQFAGGIRVSYLYEFFDQDSASTDYEGHFGLVHTDGGSKPAYSALQHLINRLRDSSGNAATFAPASLHYQLDAPASVHQLLLQRADGTFFLALWNEVVSYRFNPDVRNQGVDVSAAANTVLATLRLSDRYGCASFTPAPEQTATARTWSNASQLDLELMDAAAVVSLTPPGVPCP